MTNDEIRALLADCEDEYHLLGRNTGLNVPKLRTALETLLAREAEVLDRLPEPPDGYMSETQYARAELGADIRAILNPQESQPAALAKEKTNG